MFSEQIIKLVPQQEAWIVERFGMWTTQPFGKGSEHEHMFGAISFSLVVPNNCRFDRQENLCLDRHVQASFSAFYQQVWRFSYR